MTQNQQNLADIAEALKQAYLLVETLEKAKNSLIVEIARERQQDLSVTMAQALTGKNNDSKINTK